MPAPKGFLITPVGFDSNEDPRSLEVDADDALRIVFETAAKGLVGLHGWYSSDWQKNPLVIGFSGVERGIATMTATASDPDTLTGDTVPADEIWIVQNIAAYHNDPNARIVNINVQSNSSQYVIDMDTARATNTPLTYQGALVMAEGEELVAKFYSVVDPVGLRLHWIAMRMDIDQ